MDEPQSLKNRILFLLVPIFGSVIMASLGYSLQSHLSSRPWLQALQWLIIVWSYAMALVLVFCGLRLTSGKDS